MEPVHLAFLWHHHQPFYKDLRTGRYHLPWARLHAIKDYIGMLLVLEEFPEVRATINLVPSLLVQIADYAAGRAEDEQLRLTRKPADDLDERDTKYILDNFFLGNAERLIRPFPRYAELAARRDEFRKGAGRSPDFSAAEWRDVQVWATLAWFHPLAVARDPVLNGLREKGRDFSEEDKAAMLERQQAVIADVIPRHKRLADAGQIELTTTPFYHPILPLLCNVESARVALPDVPLPERRSDFAVDAEVQVARAVEHHARAFGSPPAGMWPAEGSVSEDLGPLVGRHGIRWIASDEMVLARSVDVNLKRDGDGNLEGPDDLYQPYRLPGGDEMPAIFFRDHHLSDLIGFVYHHGDPAAGAEDFMGRLRALASRCRGAPRLVSVILDGENPWDNYEQAGLVFLRELYSRLVKDTAIRTVRFRDYLEAHPPERKLARLHAGSWIDGTFRIWMGHEEDRTAWELVAETREAVAARGGPPTAPSSDAARMAWEEVLIAEGSDWFWWFGEEHHSEQDDLFDELFRTHLVNAYHYIGETPPERLAQPVSRPYRAAAWTGPTGPLAVVVDGRITTEGEWSSAGHCPGVAGGAMQRAAEAAVRAIRFGLMGELFCLRVDGLDAASDLESIEIVLHFSGPPARRLVLRPAEPSPARLLDEGGREQARPETVAMGEILEAACPVSLLAGEGTDGIEFFAEVSRAGSPVQRLPAAGTIALKCTPGH